MLILRLFIMFINIVHQVAHDPQLVN